MWRSRFSHLAMRRGRKIAKVAMARKLAVHLYWMWRQGWDYGQFEELGSHAGAPGNPDGVQQITDVMIGHPGPSAEGVRTSNHAQQLVIEEMAGQDHLPERNGALSERMRSCAQIVLDTAGILEKGILRQQCVDALHVDLPLTHT